VITGDPSQVDLPKGQPSGLRDAVDLLAGMDPVAVVRFTNNDVMRHSLVTRIVRAYEARDRTEDSGREPLPATPATPAVRGDGPA